ncbi:uncharacterized protein LY79DRAFT_236106 [Colletotrichum navitas]|uniref:Uncharacterized protein n=1 Tax=Colletotrichum navitas TaxID=681940 RepID=A0AAD8PX84_9PEZI|nr:uncharacterized protein LY79DRAFT_236106 [Colletotrichum navitas]KAK1589611.1 hypothetical protein LY79DRAFT_236106 [Colletotrichum navitas]
MTLHNVPSFSSFSFFSSSHFFCFFFLLHGAPTTTATPWPRDESVQPAPQPTPPPHMVQANYGRMRRQLEMDLTTCGYSDGNPTLPITALEGFQCRVDEGNGLWGLCNSGVREVSDCNFPGYCFDTHTCEKGCGKTDQGSNAISTTCTQSGQYCQTNLLAFQADMTFTEIGCGPAATTYNYFLTATESGERRATATSSKSQASPTSKNIPSPIDISKNIRDSGSSNALASISSAVSPAPQPVVSSPSNETTPKRSKLNISAIIGGTLACLALICITILAVIYLVRKYRDEESSRQKRSIFGPENINGTRPSTDSSVVNLQETQYPDPPNDRIHPNAGWGPSEAYGSEVQPNPHGPWEVLNEERPVELSDDNRPAELPDHSFLESLPTIAQAPTRSDSWRPNDDGAAWGDLRPPPVMRDRLRWANNAAASQGVESVPSPLFSRKNVSRGYRSPIMVPDDQRARGRNRLVSSSFASSLWLNRRADVRPHSTPNGRPIVEPTLHVNTESIERESTERMNTVDSLPSQRGMYRTRSATASIASSGEIYTSSPREMRSLMERSQDHGS